MASVVWQAKMSNYRWCYVPLCTNTAKNSPGKVFVSVPEDPIRRKLWFRLARRKDEPTKSNCYCCEDHLVLSEDLENFTRFRLFGGYLKLKDNAVPRYFDCQPDRKTAATPKPRPAAEKFARKRKVAEILKSHDKEQINLTENVPPNQEFDDATTKDHFDNAACCTESIPNLAIKENVLQEIICNVHSNIDSNQKNIKCSSAKINLERNNKAVQTKIYFRSKATMCNIEIPKSVNHASCSPVKIFIKDVATSPIRVQKLTNVTGQSSDSQNSTCETNSTSSQSSSFVQSSSSCNQLSTDAEGEKNKNMKKNILVITNYLINNNPKLYLGLPLEWYWLINLLSVKTGIQTDHIKLTFLKIKCNDSFERISEQFGISTFHASRIFNSCVEKVAFFLKTFIYFPSKESTIKNLPIPFRANYSNVVSIIDCFEISIQKPSNAVDQALTWSQYKTHNTVKYLISSTPDGLINFISQGYSGRISDLLLFEKCDILKEIPEKSGIMADRGFKGIQTILSSKNCTLIRPPSVSSDIKPSKEEVIETKRIASLRIHIERVINRLRSFEMLKPYTGLNIQLLKHIDSVVVIAAALCNLKNPIIKT